MADKYVDTAAFDSAGNVLKRQAIQAGGAQLEILYKTFELTAAGQANGDVLRVFKDVDTNLVPLFGVVANDAITGGTQYSLGVYNPNLGTVIDLDLFALNLDLSTATASLNPKTAKDAMAQLALSGVVDAVLLAGNKTIWELIGDKITTPPRPAVDIAFTATTAGTGGGTVTVALFFLKKGG